MRCSKKFESRVGYEENSFIDFMLDVITDEYGKNLTLNYYLKCRHFYLSNNPRLSYIKNMNYEYL